MIPRTVLMAQEVLSQLTGPQYDTFGNVIINGYSYSYPSVNTPGVPGAIDAVTFSAGTGYVDGSYPSVFLSSAGGGNYAYAEIVVLGNSVTNVTILTGGSGFQVGDQIVLGSIPQVVPGAGIPAVVTVSFINEYGVTPVLKGWTNNYQEYYTGLAPNAYGVNPGDPTMFEYNVHSFTPFEGPITAIAGYFTPGTGYTPGSYLGVATTTSGSGTGATMDVVVAADGTVIGITLISPGNDYSVGDILYPTLVPGSGASVRITGIDFQNLSGGGDSKWAQPPRRLINPTVADFVPPGPNRQAIQYSAILYPVADNPVAPPIGSL